MRLSRSGIAGYEKPSLVCPNGSRRDISILLSEIDAATLSGYWPRALSELAPQTLPEVAGEARYAPPVERVNRVFGIDVGLGAKSAHPRLGKPAGAYDAFFSDAAFEDITFEIRAGLAAVMGANSAISGLCLFTDIQPMSTYEAKIILIASRHGAFALGPYLLDLEEAGIPNPLTITLTASFGGKFRTVEFRCDLATVETASRAVSEVCPLDPGDVLLFDFITAHSQVRPAGRLGGGDLVEVGLSIFGGQHRKVVQRDPEKSS